MLIISKKIKDSLWEKKTNKAGSIEYLSLSLLVAKSKRVMDWKNEKHFAGNLLSSIKWFGSISKEL